MTIKVCPVCSVSWYADKPEKHMMTCTAKDFVPYPGPKYETVTTEEREAIDSALNRLTSHSNEAGHCLFGTTHQWDFATDTCTKCGVTYPRLPTMGDQSVFLKAVDPTGVRMWKDDATGCQYVTLTGRSGTVAITPRLKPDGSPMCGKESGQ